ncbi:hypothetical protein ACFSRY_07030 [Pontibacter locisalis]|uniref:DUF4136 domain-containing protein n=1 Tax=Pontibacter locisalis TaxID=1719035 RepID=A0ABW5IIZ0_9BACT
MMLLNTILPLLLSFVLSGPEQLRLQQDIQKDADLLRSSRYFISDNTSETASLQTIQNDLQLFGLVSNLDLSNATYSERQQGPHQVKQWKFDEGDLYSITQIESNIHLDTVITQRYLENRPPSQHRITNDFTFRTYQVATSSDPDKLVYLTEAEQGLLAYKLGEKRVEISYTSPKRGLNDLLPEYKEEVQKLLKDYSSSIR